jgi:hypothetical protein
MLNAPIELTELTEFTGLTGLTELAERSPMTWEERDPQRQNYEIRVRGHLGPKMLRAFTALAAQTEGGDTLLSGCLPDQAALYGVIAKLEALGLELVEVRYLPR